MITLPNGCNCSELTVTPKDLKTCKASAIARNWHIQYYFYDTALKKRKFVLLKGMNRFKALNERCLATQRLIENELYQLKEKGYNPITGKFFVETVSGIDPKTGFIDALRKAYDLLKLEPTTLVDVRSLIKFLEIAAKKMGLERMEIQSVKRRHLRQPHLVIIDFISSLIHTVTVLGLLLLLRIVLALSKEKNSPEICLNFNKAISFLFIPFAK